MQNEGETPQSLSAAVGTPMKPGPSRRELLQQATVAAVSAFVAPYLHLRELSLRVSTLQPSARVKACPYLMQRLTDGSITLGDAEWWARGAELLKESYSKIAFYRERGEKWRDYWVIFFGDEDSESIAPLYWEQLSKKFPTTWEAKKARCLEDYRAWMKRDKMALAQIEEKEPSSLRDQGIAAYKKEISVIEAQIQKIESA